MPPLTQRQVEVLDAIRRSIAERGFAPSTRELAAQFRWSSPAACECHLRALERKHRIRRFPRVARGIQLLDVQEGEPCVAH